MTEARRSPGDLPNTDFRTHPAWWDECPPVEEPKQPLAERCDVAVVGGGYAGLATALELARNGVDVAVLEAEAFGYNASARNSGGVSFGLDLAKVARWRKWMGGAPADPAALARGAVESVDYMEAFIADNAIDCDYHRRGRLSCAPTPRLYDELARRADRLNKLFDAGAYMLSRAEQASEIGSERFHGTMVIPRSGQLDPARFFHALLGLCRKAGAKLHDGTSVASITRMQRGFEVATSRGKVSATNVVVATNAHAAQIASTGLGRRIVPVASHIIVTEPLRPGVAEALLPNRRTGADSRRVLAYFRRMPDGARFLYGSRASPFEVSPQRAAAVIYRRMVESFPQLDGVRIGHSWGCKVGFTFDGLPHLGARDGLHYVMGCNGNGVAMMNYLGHKLARRILGSGRTDSVFDQPDFPTLPLYGGRPWFLPLVATAYGTLDRIDTLRS